MGVPAPARHSARIVFNTLLSREEASGTETKLVAYLSVVGHAKASPNYCLWVIVPLHEIPQEGTTCLSIK